MGKRLFKEILFPTDLSKQAERIHCQVKRLACSFEARLHVLTIVEPLTHVSAPHHLLDTDTSLATYQEKITERLERELKETCAVDFKCLFTVPVITTGTVHETILTYADDNRIDLIVMGTSVRAGAVDGFLGNTATRVLAGASCPVVTINPLKIEKATVEANNES